MALQLQMTWQLSLLSQKRKTGPPLGLKNLGNSCYLNSVLQCLTYTPPLANFCLQNQHSSLCDSSSEERKPDCPFCLLEKRIVRSLRLEQNQDAPVKIQSCLSIFAERFRCGRQEDAHEFLRYVIDACHNTCLSLKKLRRKGGDASTSSGGNTVVKEIFGGSLQSQVKCLSCGNESNKVDDIMDISLDVLNTSSLKDALQKFFQPEVLDGNNKYKCDNCKKLVVAKKQMSILTAPNVLVIQLKRFEVLFGNKIDKAIAFGEFLVLSSFMCKASQDPQPEYKLCGTIVHSGYSPESGHYYAYIKDAMGRWYCCNDAHVSVATLQEVLSEKVYILFFSRTNQRQVSISNGLASNGVKSHHCNGSQLSGCPKNDVLLKTVHVKPNTEQTSWKDMPTSSKIDKAPSSSRVKFNINGDSNSKRCAAIVNGKVDVSKIQSGVTNGHAKDTISLENNRKDPSSLPTSNDFAKNKVDVVDNSKRKESILSNGNTDVQCVNNHPVNSDLPKVSVRSDLTEVTADPDLTIDKRRDVIITGRGPDYHKSENNGLNNKPEVLGNKRKVHEGNCILLACDDQSRGRVQELKDILGKDVSEVLRSCGWTEKVYDFMHSRKKLRAQELRNLPSRDERKMSIIADAKRAFLSQIPESLKEDLIERLRSFNQDEIRSGGS